MADRDQRDPRGMILRSGGHDHPLVARCCCPPLRTQRGVQREGVGATGRTAVMPPRHRHLAQAGHMGLGTFVSPACHTAPAPGAVRGIKGVIPGFRQQSRLGRRRCRRITAQGGPDGIRISHCRGRFLPGPRREIMGPRRGLGPFLPSVAPREHVWRRYGHPQFSAGAPPKSIRLSAPALPEFAPSISARPALSGRPLNRTAFTPGKGLIPHARRTGGTPRYA